MTFEQCEEQFGVTPYQGETIFWGNIRGTVQEVDLDTQVATIAWHGTPGGNLLDKYATDEAMSRFISTLKSSTISIDGIWEATIDDYHDVETDTPSVPTDTRVPDSFHLTERLGVRMTLGSGEYEYDTEEWTTPTGAQERIRQIMFARADVDYCEILTYWRRKDG